MLTVRQRQQAVRVWAMRLWPVVVVPSSDGCGAPSVLVCVAVATSIARLSPGGRTGRGRGSWLMMLGGLGCGGDRRARPCPRGLSRRRGVVLCSQFGERCRGGDGGESSIRQRHLVYGTAKQSPSESRPAGVSLTKRTKRVVVVWATKKRLRITERPQSGGAKRKTKHDTPRRWCGVG